MSGFYKMIALLFAVYLISPTHAASVLGVTPIYVNRLEVGEPEQAHDAFVGDEKNPIVVLQELQDPFVREEANPEPKQDPFVREEANPEPVQLLNPYVGDVKNPEPEQDPFVREEANPEPEQDPFVREEANLLNPYVREEEHGNAFEQAEEYNPLDHYPYVVDPYDGFGPSSQEGHKEHPRNPEDQYPYVNDPYP